MIEGSMRGHQVSPERVEFGNTRSEWVRLSELNELQQTRQEYSPEAISELAQSMVYEDENGCRQFELINDLVVGVFDGEQLEAYLVEHEAYYGNPVDRSRLAPGEDGQWRIVIAGHRRRRAISENCQLAGLSPEQAYVASSVKSGITFEDALVLQLRENVHLRPPVVDEAKQIDRYFRLRARREGVMPSVASCARVLGFSETKVSEALRFARLPSEVQQEVTAGLLSYGHAVEMHTYMSALYQYYPRLYGEIYADELSRRTLQTDVTASMMTLVSKLKSEELSGASAKKKSDIIKATTHSILEASAYHDGELFVMEEATPARQQRAAERKLGQQALTIALQRLRSGTLSEREKALLDELQTTLQARPAVSSSRDMQDDMLILLQGKSA